MWASGPLSTGTATIGVLLSRGRLAGTWAATDVPMVDYGAMGNATSYRWRASITDEEMVDLVLSHGGTPSVGWWRRIREHSLGWVSARDEEELLVGFVNVAWDGCDHAFLLDTKTRGSHQHRGIGRELVKLAAAKAALAGCEWLHVDFRPELAGFYFDACGFTPTEAGLIHLKTLDDSKSGA